MANVRKYDPKSPAGAGGAAGGPTGPTGPTGPISTPVALSLTGVVEPNDPRLVTFTTTATPPMPGLVLRYSFGDGALADHPVEDRPIHAYSPGTYLAGVAAAAQPPGYNVSGDSVTVSISAVVTE